MDFDNGFVIDFFISSNEYNIFNRDRYRIVAVQNSFQLTQDAYFPPDSNESSISISSIE